MDKKFVQNVGIAPSSDTATTGVNSDIFVLTAIAIPYCQQSALAKFSDQTRAFVRSSRLPADIVKLYIRKARESFRTRTVEAI